VDQVRVTELDHEGGAWLQLLHLLSQGQTKKEVET
jgi:hypothetical protein